MATSSLETPRRPASAALATRLRSRTDVLLPTVAGIATVALTAVGSWIPSLWGDEAASALSAQRSLPSFLHEVAHVDAVHAVYYALLHLWVSVFGASPFALRFPSALATGAMVAGVIVLVRLFDGRRRLALVAAVTAALLPRLDYAGIEARSYAGTAALATWITVAAVATLQGRLDRRVGWSLFALALGFGTALNLYLGSLAVVVGCLAVSLPHGRRQLRAWAIASGAGLVLALPVIVVGVAQRHQVAFLAHRPVPARAWLVSTWFGWTPLAWLGWVLVAAAVAVALARRERVLDRGLALTVALWVGLPAGFLIGTITTLHNFTPRYLTFTAPAVAVLMALGIEAAFRSWRPAGIGVLALVIAAAIPQYAYQRTPNAENNSDWQQVAQVIGAHARAGDELAFDEEVRPSRRPELAMRLYPSSFRGLAAPQVTVPWNQTDTWHDTVLTIEHAAQQGRFTAVTVYAVETDYPDTGAVDPAGIPALERSGYRVVRHWELHSDIVYELRRDGVVPLG